MKFPRQLVKAEFLKRENRFVGQVKWKGKTIPVHIPNTGSLKGVLDIPQPCRISFSEKEGRKIPWTLEMLKVSSCWVGVNTHTPNKLVEEAWRQKKLLPEYPFSQGEVTVSEASRMDRVFWKAKGMKKVSRVLFDKEIFHFVEVKNVTLAQGDTALFPDTVTLRGRKHLLELESLLSRGHSCEMVYIVQREDCKYFRPADDIDKEYGKILRKVIKQGLQVSVFPCFLSSKAVELKADCPLIFNL